MWSSQESLLNGGYSHYPEDTAGPGKGIHVVK